MQCNHRIAQKVVALLRAVSTQYILVLLCFFVLSERANAQPKPTCAPGYTYQGGRWLAQYSPNGPAGHWIGGHCVKNPAPSPVPVVSPWTQGKNSLPPIPGYIGFGITKILLSNGTVMAQVCTNPVSCGKQWVQLRPDQKGDYANGTWRRLSDSHFERADYASTLLSDGRVFFIGGEYTDSKQQGEIYDPRTDQWTVVGQPPANLFASNEEILDAESMLISGGKVLFAPVKHAYLSNTIIYDPELNQWSAGGQFPGGRGEDEATWVKLPDESIIVPNPDNVHSERYDPAHGAWIDDATIPTIAQLYFNSEMGPGFLLPSGKALFFGGSGHTAIYSPSASSGAKGSWAAGPDIPGPGLSGTGAAADVAGAMMPNGKILISVASAAVDGGGVPPGWFYEFDPSATSGSQFKRVSAPNGASSISFTPSNIGYLVLPDGTVLANSGDASQFAYFYRSVGPALLGGKPTIKSITRNADGSFHLVGTGLNGISAGASYGDDAQMDSNYPLVRLMYPNGNVAFAFTFNWSTTGVQTGSKLVSTEFRLPAGIAGDQCGTYYLVVIANGNSSNLVRFSQKKC